ncbi:MAG: FadR family transcriptional regulator [Firmicutes bacterium]|jgi:GntR family transcriptional repressor for pyruvate dehydrogenase complex|nr:FadR family transcriptional regulator [Bacillota bacterium]
MRLKPVGRPTGLAQLVRNEIEQLIIGGNLEPGSRLPTEKELAEQLGVGRSSVREALRALEEKGIIEVVQGKGCFVCNDLQRGIKAQLEFLFNFEERPLEALTELRLIIERGLVRLAALRADEKDLEMLRELVEKVAHSGTVEELVQSGANFHLGVAICAHNTFATPLFEALTQLINELYRNVPRTEEQRQQSIHEHKKIYEAIAARDPELAVQRLEAHLANLRLDTKRSQELSDLKVGAKRKEVNRQAEIAAGAEE